LAYITNHRSGCGCTGVVLPICWKRRPRHLLQYINLHQLSTPPQCIRCGQLEASLASLVQCIGDDQPSISIFLCQSFSSINSHWATRALHHVQAPDLVKASLNNLPWWQGGIRVTNEKGMPLFFVYAKGCIHQLTCPPGTVAGLLGHLSVSARHSCRHATVAKVTNSWMVNFKTSAVLATKPLVARCDDYSVEHHTTHRADLAVRSPTSALLRYHSLRRTDGGALGIALNRCDTT
jgi:hypothetical protein